MAYITYDSAGLVQGVYSTQALADAAAAANTGWTAAQGEVSNNVEPGWTRADDGSVDVTPIAEVEERHTGATLQAEWRTRLGASFLWGVMEIQDWWPRAVLASQNNRAKEVIDFELPHWWRDAHSLVSAICEDRAFTDMTEEETDDLVAWLETLRHTGNDGLKTRNIIETWYAVGKGENRSGYYATSGWASTTIDTVPNAVMYTDMFQEAVSGAHSQFRVGARVIIPRTPDYAWNQIAWPAASAAAVEPDNWNPERPS